MKFTLAAVIFGLSLASTLEAFAQDRPETQPVDTITGAQLADPSQYDDDLCWVAPEWQDT